MDRKMGAIKTDIRKMGERKQYVPKRAPEIQKVVEYVYTDSGEKI